MKSKLKIGFTTSFPVEVIFASGHIPQDLNNVFITNSPEKAVYEAELKGFPRTICAWIKGNYQAALEAKPDEVIGIVQGDCANASSLLSILADEGIPIRHFSFPVNKNASELDREIAKLEKAYGVDREATLKQKRRLDKIRAKLVYLDELTWKSGLVSGEENHFWLVNSSDFWGDPDFYEAKLDAFLSQVKSRQPIKAKLRLAFLGVPPIYSNLYSCLHKLGAEVVYNEVQRQFAMPYLEADIISQYLRYTYPFSVFDRLEDICCELKRRKVDAVISYTQSFCHRQIDNMLLKKKIDLPFLTLEGDQPEAIDGRTQLRLESFVEVFG